ncbi:MAG: hypothetical protein ACOXZK_04830 [Bacteroidales bacterium]|jgi:Tfp pilus assembly protein PilF|nr:hypothetical protein [Bacteroidales bacterium]
MKKIVLTLVLFVFVGFVSAQIDKPLEEQYNVRGVYLLEKGDFMGAVEVFTMAIEHNANYAEAYYQRAFALSKVSEGVEGLSYCKDLERAVELKHPKAEDLVRKLNCKQ